MTNRFEYHSSDGGRLRAERDEEGVHIETSPYGCLVEPGHLEEVVAGLRDMARQAAYTAAYHQPARFPGDSPAMRAAALSCVRPERRDLTVAERQFLTFALDLAADRMATEDGFTSEDQAALDRFRSMSTGETGDPAPEPVTLRLQVGDEQAFGDMVRRIVGNGPTGSVE